MWLLENLLAYSNMIFLFKVEAQCWMDKKTTLKAVSFTAVLVFASDIYNLWHFYMHLIHKVSLKTTDLE